MPETFTLDLKRWMHDKVLLNVAALLCAGLARETAERKYTLCVSSYVSMLGMCLAVAATGVEPSDKTMLVDLHDATMDELIRMSITITSSCDTVKGLGSAEGKALLRLLATPFDNEMMRRPEGTAS